MDDFDVWFDQINQTRIHVKARTLDSAMRKAERLWVEENKPHLSCVERNGEEEWPFKDKKSPKIK